MPEIQAEIKTLFKIKTMPPLFKLNQSHTSCNKNFFSKYLFETIFTEKVSPLPHVIIYDVCCGETFHGKKRIKECDI